MPESVKVLTVCLTCRNIIGIDGEQNPLGHAPVCSHLGHTAEFVPQAELDRLRAVGEEMATELEYQRDLRVQQLEGIPDEQAVLRELVEMHIRRIDARLKSYREAVPE